MSEKLEGNITPDEFNQLQRNTIDLLKKQQEIEANQLIKCKIENKSISS